MKLKKLLKIIDPIGDVAIWTQEDDEESGPGFEGSILNIPWWMLDCKIGRAADDDDPKEPPIYLSTHTSQYNTTLPCLVINIII